jgi:hypothetical protein
MQHCSVAVNTAAKSLATHRSREIRAIPRWVSTSQFLSQAHAIQRRSETESSKSFQEPQPSIPQQIHGLMGRPDGAFFALFRFCIVMLVRKVPHDAAPCPPIASTFSQASGKDA